MRKKRSATEYLKVLVLLGLGMTAALPAAAQPRVSVVHNSPYAQVDSVDVWMINLVKALEDIHFREARAFFDFPLPGTHEVDVTAANTQTPDNPLFTKRIAFESGKTIQIVAAGEPGGTGPTALNLFTYEARETSSDPEKAEALFFHGAPTSRPSTCSSVNWAR